MKKWTNTDPMRRLLSLALSMAMVLSVLPAGALAEEVESTPPTCDCEVLCAKTVKTDCPVCGTEGGQCAAVQQQEPEQQESEQKQEPVQEPKTETCAHGNDPETCEDCASEARVASVQALIVALPEDVTAENKEAAQSALSAVDEAKSALTESEQAKLDMTRYTALTQKLAALESPAPSATEETTEKTDKVVSAWAWIDEEGYLDEETGGLAMPGASAERPAYFVDVVSLLPCEITATVDGVEETLTIDWVCDNYPEAGAYQGEYTFNATLPQGYALDEGVKALTVPVLLGGGANYDSKSNIDYLTWDDDQKTLVPAQCTTATVVTGSDTEWGTADTDTWYVVQDTVDIGTADVPQRVTVSGNVHLILADGCDFIVNGGIGVNEGNSLTIYAQSTKEDTMGSLTAQNVADGNAGIGGNSSSNFGSITINGGKITATGNGNYAAGIGSAAGNHSGAITINDGVVTATGGTNGGTGIGGGQGASTSGGSGTFSTGTDGRAVIFASSISNQSGKTDGTWSGIIFENNKGTVYGNQTLNADLTIPADKNLLIPEGTTLDISGVTVSNNGKVYVDGTLTGTFSGTGSVYYALNLTDCTASGTVPMGDKVYARQGDSITLTANEPPEGTEFISWQSGDVTIENNSFTMPDHALTVTAVFSNPVASVTVGGTVMNYGSIQNAFDAANIAEGSTLTLLTDMTADAELRVHGSFTLDLNGKKLNMGFSGISINSGSLTVKGAQENSEISSKSEFALRVSGNGTLTLKSGTIENLSLGGMDFCVRVEEGGTATIEGGVIRGRNCIYNAGTLEMKGGTLEAYCPGFIGLCIHNDNYNEDSVTITGGTLDRLDSSDMFNTAEGITLQGGSFPNGISFTDDFSVPPVRSLLADGYAFYNPSDDTLMSVGNNETGIQVGVEVLSHTHSFTCEKKDDFEHARICACGYSEAEPHDFQEGGDGFCTVCDAYQPAVGDGLSFDISNAGQLFWFADYVNSRREYEAYSAWGQLQGDITIPAKADGTKRAWTPIGTERNPYRGLFYGNGHSISGLYFADGVPYASLFGVVSPEGMIENLTIESVEYDVSVSTSNIAGICGFLDGGQITNCTNAANISSPHSQLSAAGICYENNGFISGCTNTGTIHGSVVGGICVTNNGSIEKCTNEGAIHGSDAGGICFENGSPDNYYYSSIMNCANRGQIYGRNSAGGICARNVGTVSYSYHYDSLNVNNHGGPIVGEMPGGGSCYNCYYLADWETDEIGGTTAKTAAQFASGEVAYLLNNPNSDEVIWGQTIGVQDYPVLNGEQVYRHNSSCPVYSNSPYESDHAHTPYEHDNKICGVCGAALVATVRIEEEGSNGFHGYVNLQDAFAAANEHTATITLLENVNIGNDKLTISGGNVTFESDVNHDAAAEEGPASYTITTGSADGHAIEINGGTFNFKSGTLQTSGDRRGIFVFGGTLNFQGGTIAKKISHGPYTLPMEWLISPMEPSIP